MHDEEPEPFRMTTDADASPEANAPEADAPEADAVDPDMPAEAEQRSSLESMADLIEEAERTAREQEVAATLGVQQADRSADVWGDTVVEDDVWSTTPTAEDDHVWDAGEPERGWGRPTVTHSPAARTSTADISPPDLGGVDGLDLVEGVDTGLPGDRDGRPTGAAGAGATPDPSETDAIEEPETFTFTVGAPDDVDAPPAAGGDALPPPAETVAAPAAYPAEGAGPAAPTEPAGADAARAGAAPPLPARPPSRRPASDDDLSWLDGLDEALQQQVELVDEEEGDGGAELPPAPTTDAEEPAELGPGVLAFSSSGSKRRRGLFGS